MQDIKYFTRELLLASPGFTVVRADNLLLNRSEALKVSHTPGQQILLDAERIGKLSHPSNVRVLNAGIVDLGEKQSVVVMPYVDGEPLDALLEREGPLSPLRACRLLGQILSALDEAHRAGLVYGSLSPHNIRHNAAVTEQVRIADYGLSAPIKDNHQTSPTHLLSADPSYTAPERFLGSLPTPRGDLFSVGVIFYELLTGKKPFPHAGFGLLQAYQRDTPPLPMGEHAELPRMLEQLIEQMMVVDADRRIQSARDAASRLLQLDPDELQAYSTSPLLERDALSMDLHVSTPQPDDAPLDDDAPIADQPEIWVLVDDPAFRLPSSQDLLAALEERYTVWRIDAAAASRALEQLEQGERPPPWVVLFGDLHVILGEPLLAALGARGDLSRVLMSTHLNADMMHTTVNLCSLDQQVLAGTPIATILASVEAMVARTRAILTTSTRTHAQLRGAQSTIADLRQRLAARQRATNASVHTATTSLSRRL